MRSYQEYYDENVYIERARGMDAELNWKNQELVSFWNQFRDAADFNPAGFWQLYEDTGEETSLRILAHFVETLKETAQNIRDALVTDNCEPIWRACHKVAGSGELIGFVDYGNFAREVSHQVKANPVCSSHGHEIRNFLELTESLQQRISKAFPNLARYL